MVKKVLRIAAIILLMLVVLSSSALATTGTVTGTTVRIRKEANSNSAEVSAAKKGEKVEIIGEEGDWYKVNFEKVTGYMSKEYVSTDGSVPVSTPDPEPVPEPVVTEDSTSEPEQTVEEPVEAPVETTSDVVEENQTVTLTNDVVLRYLPSFTSRQKSIASNGSTYTIKASLNNWVKLSNDAGSGWALKNAVEGTITETTEQETTETTSEQLVEETPTMETPEVSKGKVNVDSARIRKSPNGDVLDSISKGTEVTILGEEDGWYKIKTDKYEECYIAKRLITEN